uniref:SecY-independent transporter protein n=1 Tax=Scytothamnus australis TaxID=66621 RepID=UPI002E7A0058|nr:SecY-independent transporter protein [Scytothamnus australis]WBP70293.1 SecY-independent transporter protein [Scytothamnus australis]
MKKPLTIYYVYELKFRLLYTAYAIAILFFITYGYKQALIFLFLPQGLSYFVTTQITEVLFTYLQICTFTSLSLGLFLFMIQLYLFLRPGLYVQESRSIATALIFIFLFYTLLYLLLLPLIVQVTWKLFSEYSYDFVPVSLTFEPKLADYLTHLQKLSMLLGLSLPIFITIILIHYALNKKNLTKYRSISYVIAFFFAAFVTPPDLLSQLIVGITIILFYEAQLFCLALFKNYNYARSTRQPIKSYQNSNREKKKT